MIKSDWILLIGFACIALSSCSCSNATDTAKSCGEHCAQEIIEAQPMTDMQMQEMLLEVRAKEYLYRSAGNEDAADAYIKAFTEYIIIHNDSLAEVIAIKQ